MKIIANISINPEVWALARKMYPNKLSTLIENYLKGLINTDFKIEEHSEIDLDLKVQNIEQDITKLKIMKDAIEAKQKQMKEDKEKQDKEKIDQGFLMIKSLKAAGFD